MTPAKKSTEKTNWINKLYYGDNLDILRDYIADESVDLIYLDPPFNSKATYNVMYKSSGGGESPAQIEAFDDTWHWDDMVAGKIIQEIKNSNYQQLATALDSMVAFLGKNAMTAYLSMIAIRLIELHRVLKPTGSLYLHCDPTASHYLKMLLDATFGVKRFKNEIIWGYRTGGNSRKTFARKHDVIFFYAKKDTYMFNTQFYLSKQKYKYGFGKSHNYELIEKDGDYYKNAICRDIWDDIDAVGTMGRKSDKRLGYPTQKPVALMERIVAASSNKGDVVLDPFCGCGTTIHAAQKMGRKWIGVDVTPIAINLVETRLFDAFPKVKNFEIIGLPKDIDGAHKLFNEDKTTKKVFEKWACSLIKAYPQNQGKKGADGGIDGLFWFGAKSEYKAIVSVKGGKNVGVAQVRELVDVVREQKADIGVFLTLTPPTAPMNDWAKQAGVFETQAHGDAPRIQIITIEEALKKRERAVDTVLPRGGAYNQATQEETPATMEDLLED
ncbi:MAG: restriction endonuclease [Proteobacteria bacterium]|nr:restriction endonuclease [Pseudomonadota bacterium]